MWARVGGRAALNRCLAPLGPRALSDLGYREGDFPEAERAAKEILSLPMYPHITEAQQQRVVEVLRRAL